MGAKMESRGGDGSSETRGGEEAMGMFHDEIKMF